MGMEPILILFGECVIVVFGEQFIEPMEAELSPFILPKSMYGDSSHGLPCEDYKMFASWQHSLLLF